MRRRTHLLGLGLLALTALVYWPGLEGPFLFDDFSNLALLSQAGRLDRLDNVIHYLLSGFAGPTGRPLAMASFIPEAAHWPDDPFPFKRTNLLLHLVNIALLAAVTRRLLLAWGHSGTAARNTAWLAAGLWGLHPLWVSTTLYVVQRMTLLATLFSLLGIALYLAGRARLAAGRTRSGLAWVALAVYGMGLFATLSKENGALLPLLLLTLERYGLSPAAPLPEASRRWLAALVGLPALAVLGYLASFLPSLVSGDAGIRAFTPLERLLTEGRVIWTYVGSLLLPLPTAGGLYAQEISVSHGLFSPWSTVWAWAGLAAVWAMAERLRPRHAAISLALTFFLTGHLLESTWIPLELAFEHRNYLPAVFLFLPVALWVGRLRPARRTLAAGTVIAVLATMTVWRADLWGRPFAQALAWAQQNPDSPRAQAHLASLWLETGNDEEAARLLDAALRRHPTDFLLAANRFLVACRSGHLPPAELERLAAALRRAPFQNPVLRYQTSRVLAPLREGQCGPASYDAFATVWQAAWEAAGSDPGSQAMLLQERALAALTRHDAASAWRDLRDALALTGQPDMQLAGAATLASHGALREALALLDQPLPTAARRGTPVERLREAWLARSGYWQRERAHLRALITADLAALPATDDSAKVGRP